MWKEKHDIKEKYRVKRILPKDKKIDIQISVLVLHDFNFCVMQNNKRKRKSTNFKVDSIKS